MVPRALRVQHRPQWGLLCSALSCTLSRLESTVGFYLTMSHQQEGSSSSIDESDLLPTQTAGYRVGQQKTIDELQGLDKDDEALNRWKQSLLGNAAPGSAAGAKPVVSALHYHSLLLTSMTVL